MKSLLFTKDFGILVLRVGIGIMFILHGLPKLMGGPTAWEKLAQFGLPFLPEGILAMIFGLSAAIAEGVGGLFLILGLYHRITCLALAATMAVALSTKLGGVTGFADFAKTAGWPLELLIVFIALFFMGAGRLKIGKTD
ncbi:MAG TPA: DoxX family protein [Opitutae bacterium]|nr:DoxX family protein [Opitutae bacterium]